MACSNPIYANSADVNYFGFNTVFNPYNKSMTFDIAGITTFKTGGEDNISAIVFEVTDPNQNTYSVTLNPSDGDETATITGLEQGVLYFGQYSIKGTLYQPATSDEDAETFVIEFDVNVCYDPKLNNKNLAVGCVLIDVDCNAATLTIKEGANMKFAGKQIATIDGCPYITTLGTITYPTDVETSEPFLPTVTFTYTPYELSLANSITGLYVVQLITTAYYELGCNAFLAIEYRSNVNKEVLCGNGMCEITCCFTESIDIIKKGGSKGAQMAELMAEAIPYFAAAQLLADCGKNNDKYVKKVKEILNCDCKCDTKSLLIQPNPITFAGKNLIGTCGTTITQDENGDYLVKSFVYRFEPAPDEDKISFETVQPNACTKLTYVTIHCDKIERCIYNILATDIDILNQWKELLGITDCCEGIVITNTPELLQLTKLSPDFATLEDTYFVKNDIITGVQYEDNTQITGGALQHIKYYDQIIQQAGIIYSAGTNITLPCQVCGGSITDLTGYKLISEAITPCGCTETTNCDLDTPRVDYSERYGSAYRFNPQIEEPCYTTETVLIDGNPYTSYKVYFGDTQQDSSWSSIRIITILVDNIGNITVGEARTIIGADMGDINTPTTNNTWGNFVGLNRPSSVNLDFDEIVNGEPVLYFVTFAGYICRAVRERSSECDERANWKVYVIGTTSASLYGMKKFIVDANGNRSFIYFNASAEKLYAFTYDNAGSKNAAANWVSTDILVACLGATASNFNVELTKNYIFTVEEGQIKLTIYMGGAALANIQNSANYLQYVVCTNPSASPTSYLDGLGTVATLAQPTWIQKIVVGGEDRYYFGNADLDNSNSYIKWSYVRYFTLVGGDVTDPASWEFFTDIVVNNNSVQGDGTWNPDVSSNVNGASQGMFILGGSGTLAVSMFLYGTKTFNFTSHVVTILTGQATNGGDLVIDENMDTQYAYTLSNCETGSDE